MNERTPASTHDLALAAMRIAVGLAFFTHGGQKLFGWFGGFGADGTAEMMSEFGAAGVIEFFCGALIVVGLLTRPAAFLASGEMAVAYFWKHLGSSGDVWWWQNRGELVMIFSFVWLFLAVAGPGRYSLDGWLRARRVGPSAPV